LYRVSPEITATPAAVLDAIAIDRLDDISVINCERDDAQIICLTDDNPISSVAMSLADFVEHATTCFEAA
jgi:hypothetical protein